MRKAIIGLAVGLLAMATVGVVAAQDGRVDTPCAGYAVDAAQDPTGYDMLLTVPMPPEGFQGLLIEINGRSHISPEGDGFGNVFRVPFTVADIGSGAPLLRPIMDSRQRAGGIRLRRNWIV